MPRIAPQKFAHIVYRTRRFEEMLTWYKTVFGAEVRHQNPALAFLTYDDEHHRFAFANMRVLDPQGQQVEKEGVIGVDHVAYTFGSLDELLDHYAALKAEGIKPYWCIHHGITVSMYYADPDRNQMEFQIECFDSLAKANAFMEGPGFAQNPIGVEFDPEDLLARRQAGTLGDFLTREVHLPVSPLRGAGSRPA